MADDDFDAGTATDAGEADLGTAPDPGTAEPSAASATAGPPESGLETLIDPATLPDELKPHWSRMTAAYNKRLGALREQGKEVEGLRQKAAVVDRFYSDPAYARQVIQQMATQLGIPLSASAPPAAAGEARSPGGVPQTVMTAVQQALADDPNMAFLAPVVAKAAWVVAQQAMQPLEEEKKHSAAQQRETEYAALVQSLAERVPDWETYQPEMEQIVHFLRNALNGTGPLRHPQYGSLLEWVFSKASGMQFATGEAGKRMQKALGNTTKTGSAAPARGPSTQELISKADSFQDKFAIAFRAAVADANNRTP